MTKSYWSFCVRVYIAALSCFTASRRSTQTPSVRSTAAIFKTLSYLEPSRGALCDNAVVDTSLRRSGAPYLGFRIVWRGIIVPELCSSAVGVLDLSGSIRPTVQLGHDNNGAGRQLVTKDRLVCVWGL